MIRKHEFVPTKSYNRKHCKWCGVYEDYKSHFECMLREAPKEVKAEDDIFGLLMEALCGRGSGFYGKENN